MLPSAAAPRTTVPPPSPADPRNTPQRRPSALPVDRGRPTRTSATRAPPAGSGATPPKAGPGTAGFQPARSRTPHHCRQGRGRCAPPPSPADPRNTPQRRPGPLPVCMGVPPARRRPTRRSPGAAQPRRRRGPGPRVSCPHVPAHRSVAGKGAVVAPRPRAPRIPAIPRNVARARFLYAWASRPHVGAPRGARRERHNPAEGGARDRGLPARTFPHTAALPARARSLRPAPEPRGSPQCRPSALPVCMGVPPARRRPTRRSPGAAQPRRRRGPGPQASCPPVPARRSVAGKGAVVAPRPRAPRIPAIPRNGARAHFPGSRASRPHVSTPAHARGRGAKTALPQHTPRRAPMPRLRRGCGPGRRSLNGQCRQSLV